MGEGDKSFMCSIDHPYALARYPVTNRQYRLFLDTLDDKRFEQYCPHYWVEGRYPVGEGNHPVRGVNWSRANEFARWVHNKLRAAGALGEHQIIRLPTEPEWERAAAYPEVLPSDFDTLQKRQYPWGDWSEIDIHANTEESKIGKTSVVGIFPHGASDCGAYDLAGNVWEWCNTLYQPYPLREHLVTPDSYHWEKGVACVRRGGSWGRNHFHARVISRKGELGGNYEAVGFRLARVFAS